MITIVLPDIPAEDRLLQEARQGSKEAIMRIYESYFPPIYNFIRLRVDDRNVAEDIAAEVFLRLVTSFKNGQGPRHSLRGWLFQVARNELADHFGSRDHLTLEAIEEWLPGPGDEEPEIAFLRSLSIERVRRALRMLAPDQQEVLILRFGQGLDLQETATILGRSAGAVKSLQFRAVSTLRHVLGESQPDASGV